MGDTDVDISFVHVFEVTAEGAVQLGTLWAAAVPRDKAVTAVEKAIPFGWYATLAEERFSGVGLPVSLEQGQMYRIERETAAGVQA